MHRQALSVIGVPAVIVAALVWAAGPALAQHGGGGHGGGGHGGGGHGGAGGGFHGGGSIGHFSGGARPSGFRGGMPFGPRPGAGSAGVARMIRPGVANGRVYGGAGFGAAAFRNVHRHGFISGGGYYGGYPFVGSAWYGAFNGSGSFDNSYYFGPSTDASISSVAPFYNNSYYFGDSSGPVAYDLDSSVDTLPSGDVPVSNPPEKPATNPNVASLVLKVPADAEIWFDGTKMTLTGIERHYVTPPLAPDQDYAYIVRARWTVNGRVVDQTHKVSFRPGQTILVDFLTPPPTTGEQPMTP